MHCEKVFSRCKYQSYLVFLSVVACLVFTSCIGTHQADAYLTDRGVSVWGYTDDNGRRAIDGLHFSNGTLAIKKKDWRIINRISKQINEFHVNDAYLFAEDIENVSALSNLQRLSLVNCTLPVEELNKLRRCEQLHTVQLTGHEITDDVLVQLADIPNLAALIIEDASVTGEGLASYAGSNVISIDFQNCKKLNSAVIRNAVHLMKENPDFGIGFTECNITSKDYEEYIEKHPKIKEFLEKSYRNTRPSRFPLRGSRGSAPLE